MLHGWYSHSQALAFGYAVFRGEKGDMVLVSESSYEDKPCGKFKDYIYQGVLKDLVANYDKHGNQTNLSLKEVCEELDDSDIIESKPSVLMHSTMPNARDEWNKELSKVNSKNLFPLFTHSTKQFVIGVN